MQYFTIVPMRNIGRLKGVWAAVKADTLSIVASQAGLFLGMRVYQGGIFSPGLPKTSAPYWMLMRLSVVLGSFAAWPAHAVQGVVGWSTASSRSSAFEADLRRIRAPRARNRSHPTRSPLSGTRRRVQERRGGWLNAGSSSASPPSGKNRPGGRRSIAKTFA